jgi:vacuolar-type H+-ATPase subunit H
MRLSLKSRKQEHVEEVRNIIHDLDKRLNQAAKEIAYASDKELKQKAKKIRSMAETLKKYQRYYKILIL